MQRSLLEPCAGKLARTVLRGGWRSNASSLPGEFKEAARMGADLEDVEVPEGIPEAERSKLMENVREDLSSKTKEMKEFFYPRFVGRADSYGSYGEVAAKDRPEASNFDFKSFRRVS